MIYWRENLRRGSNIENAMAKGAECDGGVAEDASVGEHHLQDGDVSDDRR